jgi:hypothetical protein
VLAEPPAVSLLRHLPDEQAVKGNAMFADIQKRMVEPMQRRFAEGDAEGGVEIFVDYVFNDPRAWAGMSQADRTATLRAAHEWDLMMTSGQLFPEIDAAALRKISVPVLVMSGGCGSFIHNCVGMTRSPSSAAIGHAEARGCATNDRRTTLMSALRRKAVIPDNMWRQT